MARGGVVEQYHPQHEDGRALQLFSLMLNNCVVTVCTLYD